MVYYVRSALRIVIYKVLDLCVFIISGVYSRHINDKHRLVYYFKESTIIILVCKTHYKDKYAWFKWILFY